MVLKPFALILFEAELDSRFKILWERILSCWIGAQISHSARAPPEELLGLKERSPWVISLCLLTSIDFCRGGLGETEPKQLWGDFPGWDVWVVLVGRDPWLFSALSWHCWWDLVLYRTWISLFAWQFPWSVGFPFPFSSLYKNLMQNNIGFVLFKHQWIFHRLDFRFPFSFPCIFFLSLQITWQSKQETNNKNRRFIRISHFNAFLLLRSPVISEMNAKVFTALWVLFKSI